MAGTMMQFDSADAQRVAKSIGSKGDNVKTLVAQLDKEIKAVSAWWKGESATAFIDEFQALKPSLDKMHECVTNISANLSKVAELKLKSEQDMANALRK